MTFFSNFFSNFLRDLPVYLLSLPVLLMAFSVHESAHGLMAYKLGDPTAGAFRPIRSSTLTRWVRSA